MVSRTYNEVPLYNCFSGSNEIISFVLYCLLTTDIICGPKDLAIPSVLCSSTVEPRYNEALGTMKFTLLYQVSHYIRVK